MRHLYYVIILYAYYSFMFSSRFNARPVFVAMNVCRAHATVNLVTFIRAAPMKKVT